MTYAKCIPSLTEMATSQVALNFSEDNDLKKATLLCEPDKWSFKKTKEWDEALNKQCYRLTLELPQSLKQGIHIWMSRIAYSYLSYAMRMENLFQIERNFFINFVSRKDWTGSCYLDEKKIAKRILVDEKVTLLQKYRVACVYCLHRSIPYLWNSLSPEQKKNMTGSHGISHVQENNDFVLLWSYYMDGHRESVVTGRKNSLWMYAMQLAVEYGNKAILMQCWKRLNKKAQKQNIIDWATTSAIIWMDMQRSGTWKFDFMYNVFHCYDRPVNFISFNLPHYYSELVYFLLSKMQERQQLKYFEMASDNNLSVRPDLPFLDLFLEWPLLDYFLPTIRKFWAIISKEHYGNCLLVLANKIRKEPENLSYNYSSILWNLWKESPEDYKEYVCNRWGSSDKSIIELLLSRLLMKTAFKKKDAELFTHIWQDVPQEIRKAAVIDTDNSDNNITCIMIEKGMWSSLNNFIEQCLSNIEIPNFKQKITNLWGFFNCATNLKENNEEYVSDFINWAFESDTDKKHFKYNLVTQRDVEVYCSHLLLRGKINEMERIINFCLESEEMKFEVKSAVVKITCRELLKDFAWEEMTKYIALIFDTEEKILNFKRGFFYSDSLAIDTVHHNLVFNDLCPQWENAEKFYQWFCLSSEEVKNLKRKTAFHYRVFDRVLSTLYENKGSFYREKLIKSLNWCLTDEEMVIHFKENFEIFSSSFQVNGVTNNKNKCYAEEKRKDLLHNFINELLQNCGKHATHEQTNCEGNFKNEAKQKRPIISKDNEKIKKFKN